MELRALQIPVAGFRQPRFKKSLPTLTLPGTRRLKAARTPAPRLALGHPAVMDSQSKWLTGVKVKAVRPSNQIFI